MLPFLSAAICAAKDRPESAERLTGAGNVAPESVERAKKISRLPGVLSSQDTLILAPASTVSQGLEEKPELRETFCAVENVAPPSLDRAKKMSVLRSAGLISAQTTLMLPPASTAMNGLEEKVELLEMFFGPEKLTPPSVERLMKISKLPGLSFAQTTLILPFLSTAICGSIEPAVLVESIFGAENVAPPSLEPLNQMARLPVSLSQTTLMLPAVSTAICGTENKAVVIVAERFVGVEN